MISIYLTSRPAELSQILEKKTEAGIDNILQLLPRKNLGPSAVLAFYKTEITLFEMYKNFFMMLIANTRRRFF